MPAWRSRASGCGWAEVSIQTLLLGRVRLNVEMIVVVGLNV